MRVERPAAVDRAAGLLDHAAAPLVRARAATRWNANAVARRVRPGALPETARSDSVSVDEVLEEHAHIIEHLLEMNAVLRDDNERMRVEMQEDSAVAEDLHYDVQRRLNRMEIAMEDLQDREDQNRPAPTHRRLTARRT